MERQVQTRLYVSVVAAAAMGLVGYLAYLTPSVSQEQIEAAVFFCFAAFLGHQAAYRLPKGGFGDISFIPLLAGVAVAPGVSVVIGTAVALLVSEYLRRRETIKIVFNAAQFTIAVGLSVVMFNRLGGTALGLDSVSKMLPFAAAYGTFFLTNAFLFSGVVAVSTSERFGAVLARSAGGAAVVHLVGIPIVYGFAYAYLLVGWLWSGALLVPMFGLRQMYKMNRELQTVNEDLLQLMVAAIEARDPYTSGHSQRVAEYSRVVGHVAGLGVRATERVYTAALLHDVGKIHEEFAPILRKPGRLTEDEFAIMRSHSEKGAALVSKVSQFVDLIPAIRAHHEAWDGSGYPNGLAGDRIPLWARVITFADTIDAMTTDRPYREALNTDAVREEIRRQAGKQFDPKLAELLTSDVKWKEMAATIRKNRHTHIPVSQEGPALPRHSASYETPYQGTAAIAPPRSSVRL
jgi:HD superfamily phosphohydrolase YqeK